MNSFWRHWKWEMGVMQSAKPPLLTSTNFSDAEHVFLFTPFSLIFCDIFAFFAFFCVFCDIFAFFAFFCVFRVFLWKNLQNLTVIVCCQILHKATAKFLSNTNLKISEFNWMLNASRRYSKERVVVPGACTIILFTAVIYGFS
jgi:hypothetical protein